MEPSIAKRLVQLNNQFYQTFALQFSATRQRLQPGVLKVLESLPLTGRILDLGCGNGELRRALEARGQAGRYVGLDFSPGLLTEAAQGIEPRLETQLLERDLSSGDWDAGLEDGAFDFVLAFAVLHHLPGQHLRLEVLHKVRRLLATSGRFFHSEWQFLSSQRLQERIQPWQGSGIAPDQVDPGDYLLDWRSGGQGIRYVHLFDPDELAKLARAAGFQIMDTFFSDGENGRLSLYQAWVRQDSR